MKTIYNRFGRWAAKGIRDDIFRKLADAGGSPETLMLDATITMAHRCAAGGKGGRQIRRSAALAAAA